MLSVCKTPQGDPSATNKEPTPMREMMRDQLPLMQGPIEHQHAQELAAMSQVLDQCSGVLQLAERDLVRDHDESFGRPGLSADQVVRALVIKQLNGFSYAELAFHLADSTSYRRFCRIGALEKPPSRSTLQENIKRVSEGTLEAISRQVLALAKETSVEKGDVVRGDCTTVETSVHAPTDSWLLWDTVRVLVRELRRWREHGIEFTDHRRRVKRRWRAIGNARNHEERLPLYRDQLRMTEETLADAARAAVRLAAVPSPKARRSFFILEDHIRLGRRVVDQTRRRVLDGESVPSREKVVSIFEPHTDVIVSGRPEVGYGHKVFLTTGKSSMVLDCVVLEGNPADSSLPTRMMERHCKAFDVAPLAVTFDGGFASQTNLTELKAMGIPAVVFSKRRGLSIHDMVTESWIYKRLHDFRAGIEGCISFLKRCFGLRRCTWRGFASFKAYVWGSILSANVLILARHRMAPV
jgi:IS5 family transposase